jgi:hypothetical protein
MQKLQDKVIVAASAASVLLTDHLAEQMEMMKNIVFPKFLLSKTRYSFDHKMLFDALEEYVNSADTVNLTVGDLQELDFFKRVSKEDVINDNSMIPSLYAAMGYEKNIIEWPVEKILPGITIVLGGRGAGKTSYLLNEKELDVLIRLNEPMEHVDANPEVYQATSVTNAISVALYLSLMGLRVAIDSFKSLVYGIEGAALSGGMSAGVFDFMTTVNNLVANFGAHFVVTVNPMDSDRVAKTYDMLAASVTGIVLIENYHDTSSTYRLIDGRVSDQSDLLMMDHGLGEDSYKMVGPNRPVVVPEDVAPVVKDPLTSRFSDSEEDTSPRTAGKLNL